LVTRTARDRDHFEEAGVNLRPQSAKPIARKQGLVIQELPDEVLVYDLERDRAHCLNETAAFVWQRCNGRRSIAQIAKILGHHLDCVVDENIVWLALDQLSRNHLLEKQTAIPQTITTMNRRALVRAMGLTAAVAIPLVTSILAPTLHAPVSCIPQNAACDPLTGPPCCSGLSCSGGTCQPPNP